MVIKTDFIKKIILAFTAFVFLYTLHFALELQHYKRCKFTIFHVIMYRKSDMCVYLENVLSIIESVCSKDIFNLMDSATMHIGAVLSGLI